MSWKYNLSYLLNWNMFGGSNKMIVQTGLSILCTVVIVKTGDRVDDLIE